MQRQTLASTTGAAIIENGKITKSGEKKKRLCQKWGLTLTLILTLIFQFSVGLNFAHFLSGFVSRDVSAGACWRRELICFCASFKLS